MKVIERYIFRRTLMLFCASLVWTLAIVWTTQILARINLVTDSGQSAMSFFEIAALILPSVLPVVMPFAAIIAIAQTLTVMNNDSEMVVIVQNWICPLPLIRLGSFEVRSGLIASQVSPRSVLRSKNCAPVYIVEVL